MQAAPRQMAVSTLVLMDSWIKTAWGKRSHVRDPVSTLVLMDSWIKTVREKLGGIVETEFQPLF